MREVFKKLFPKHQKINWSDINIEFREILVCTLNKLFFVALLLPPPGVHQCSVQPHGFFCDFGDGTQVQFLQDRQSPTQRLSCLALFNLTQRRMALFAAQSRCRI